MGNVEFIAPEIICSEPVQYSTDIWSVGVLTYVLFSGISPFLDDSDEETCNNIVRVDYIFPVQYFSDKLEMFKSFVNSVLMRDPTFVFQ